MHSIVYTGGISIMVKLNQTRADVQKLFRDSAKLKRVKVDSFRTKIVGANEEKIQDIKTGLDSQILLSTKHEKKAKKELKRLGILHG